MQEDDLYPPNAAPPVSLGDTWPPPRLEWTAQDAAFVAAIRESPDDDTPRLIYADWLTDLGDPRGLFIHLDIACLAERDHLRLRMLLRDRRRLLQRYEPWWSPAEKVVAIGGFTRGFLESVTMLPWQVVQYGEEVFAREPIYELRLDATELHPGHGLMECATLRHVTRLRITVDDEDFWLGTVLNARHLTALQALTIASGHEPEGVLPGHVAAVARCAALPGLHTLRLAGIGYPSLAGLLAAPGFRVERLEVPGWCEPAPSNPLDDEGPAVLHHESIGQAGLELLAQHPASRSLRYLDASYNPVSLVLPALLASPYLANLETIRVSDRAELDVRALRGVSSGTPS